MLGSPAPLSQLVATEPMSTVSQLVWGAGAPHSWHRVHFPSPGVSLKGGKPAVGFRVEAGLRAQLSPKGLYQSGYLMTAASAPPQ